MAKKSIKVGFYTGVHSGLAKDLRSLLKVRKLVRVGGFKVVVLHPGQPSRFIGIALFDACEKHHTVLTEALIRSHGEEIKKQLQANESLSNVRLGDSLKLSALRQMVVEKLGKKALKPKRRKCMTAGARDYDYDMDDDADCGVDGDLTIGARPAKSSKKKGKKKKGKAKAAKAVKTAKKAAKKSGKKAPKVTKASAASKKGKKDAKKGGAKKGGAKKGGAKKGGAKALFKHMTQVFKEYKDYGCADDLARAVAVLSAYGVQPERTNKLRKKYGAEVVKEALEIVGGGEVKKASTASSGRPMAATTGGKVSKKKKKKAAKKHKAKAARKHKAKAKKAGKKHAKKHKAKAAKKHKAKAKKVGKKHAKKHKAKKAAKVTKVAAKGKKKKKKGSKGKAKARTTGGTVPAVAGWEQRLERAVSGYRPTYGQNPMYGRVGSRLGARPNPYGDIFGR